MKTIFDHLRECAGNGDMPTLDAGDAQRIVETYDELLGALQAFDVAAKESGSVIGFAGKALGLLKKARVAIKRATESRPLQIERG